MFTSSCRTAGMNILPNPFCDIQLFMIYLYLYWKYFRLPFIFIYKIYFCMLCPEQQDKATVMTCWVNSNGGDEWALTGEYTLKIT